MAKASKKVPPGFKPKAKAAKKVGKQYFSKSKPSSKAPMKKK